MAAIYRTISEARKLAESLRPALKHEQVQVKMGVGKRLYEQILHFDPVIVGDKLTLEDEKNIREFIESCKGVAFPKEKNDPEPATETQKWVNRYPNSPLMKALEHLSDAAEKVKAMGYNVEIDITKKKEEF